jgi:hypothetical protein
VGEIVAKHLTWLFIAWWTGGAWMLYFSVGASEHHRRHIMS